MLQAKKAYPFPPLTSCSNSTMAPVKRPIASVSEDDSDLEEDGSSLGSDSSQTIPVSLVVYSKLEN